MTFGDFFFWMIFRFNLARSCIIHFKFSYNLERLYESYEIRSWANVPARVHEPPAGPPKLDLDLEIDHFFENSLILRCHARTYSSVQLFLKRIDGHNECISG